MLMFYLPFYLLNMLPEPIASEKRPLMSVNRHGNQITVISAIYSQSSIVRPVQCTVLSCHYMQSDCVLYSIAGLELEMQQTIGK